MLLKKRYGRPLSALSLSLAMAFAPLFNVQAAEPEVVPGDSSATPGELSVALSQSDGQSPAVAKLAGEQPLSMEAAANSRAQIEALLPAGYKPVFMNPLVSLYAARDMKPMWENREAVQAFQQQLAEIAIAGFQPQFTTWVSLLTDPAVTGMARDVVLSDAMMGYLHFISGIPTQGTRWLYSSTPYKMATPPLSVINQWQLALDNGSLPAFIAGLAPRHPQYEAMHQSLLALVADSRPWPQMTGSGSLRPGEWSNDIGALREILQRTGMLENSANIVLPGDVVSPSAKKRASPRRAVCTIASWWRALSAFRPCRGWGRMGSSANPPVTGSMSHRRSALACWR